MVQSIYLSRFDDRLLWITSGFDMFCIILWPIQDILKAIKLFQALSNTDIICHNEAKYDFSQMDIS